MVLLICIKNIGLSFKLRLKKIYGTAKLSKENPSCCFDFDSEIFSSSFEKFVVIFGNTKLYQVNVGAYSYIQAGGRIFNCDIGRFCSIAASVSIAPGIHDMNKVSTHPSLAQKSTPLPKVYAKTESIITSERVCIGNDVWIGEKVVILDGLKIGNGAVIAAGAIVVKDVEPYSVVGGVPAKHIKYRFNDETIKILQKSQWWNFSEEWFEKNAGLMLDTNKFIEYLKCL